MKKLMTLAMVFSALLFGISAVAVANPHNVSPGDDIQAVIDTAIPGDTIVFALGTYSLSSTLNVNNSLTLTSADPYAATKPVIDGGGTLGMIIYIAASDVTVDGLEIASGTGDLIRQSGAYSGTTITNCVVRDSSGDEGIQLKACTDCLVECNVVYDVAQDGISIAEGSYNSVIRNNEIYSVGSENAAIYVYDSYDMTVECNYIHDTPAANGIKMYKNYGGTHVIANNLIVHNSWQGGKRCYDEADGSTINIYKPRVASTYDVMHNTLGDNTGVDACGNPTGHAIYVNDYDGSGFVTNVDDNIVTTHNGYGIRVFFGAAVNYSYNDLWQNALGATDGNPVDGGDNMYADPLYNTDYTLQDGSPCIGTASDGEDMGVLFDNCVCGPPNQAPVADPNGPYLGAVDTLIGFEGEGSSDPENDPLTYAWDFGDSNTGSGATPSHTYAAAGIYDVCLTVNDGTVDSDQVCTIAVVYDPDGGFVTGGGWIDSPAGAYKVPTTMNYGDLTLNYPWWNISFPELWDLTACDLNINYGLDLSQMGAGFVPIQVGLREPGAVNIDPDGQAGWMQANPQLADSTNPNSLDDDDHFLLVNHGWESDELDYDVYPDGSIADTPFGTNDTAAFWFDRDGVDSTQATQWDMSQNGTAYNTGGQYTVSVDYLYLPLEGLGTMFATINDGQQGIYTSGWQNAQPDIFPAGKSFGLTSGDFTQLQLFVGSGQINGKVEITDLAVTGCGDVIVGKANFGFVSKYKKGADVPTGNTEFVFKAADLNFHSDSYDWLVVTGSNYAKFKGAGTIYGEPAPNSEDYKFKLWAGDDDPDTFRIKIWWEDTDSEHVVYDNGMDQPIGGGSIVIHKSKK